MVNIFINLLKEFISQLFNSSINKECRRLILTLLCFFFILSETKASDFTASVFPNPVGVGEQLTVEFKLKNGHGSSFRPPKFDGFRLVSGPAVGYSETNVNGNSTRAETYSYTLLPLKTGKFSIGAALIFDGQKAVNSNPVTVTVVKSTGRSQTRNMPQSLFPMQSLKPQKIDISNAAFLQMETKKTRIYEREPLIVDYKLYFKEGIQPMRVLGSDEPQFDGFIKHNINVGNQILEKVTRNGAVYNTVLLKRMLLHTTSNGEFKIKPLVVEYVFGVGSALSMFYDEIRRKLSSNDLVINVKPLPEPMPPGFCGAVGEIKADAKLVKSVLKPGEETLLRISFSGSAVAASISEPKLPVVDGVSVSSPQMVDSSYLTEVDNGLNLVFEYPVVAEKAGEYEIEIPAVYYFDTRTGKYSSVEFPTLKLKVTSAQAVAEGTLDKNEGMISVLIVLLILLIIAAFILFYFYRRLRDKKEKIKANTWFNSKYRENNAADKAFIKRLYAIENEILSNQVADPFEQVYKLAIDFVTKYYNISADSLSHDNIYNIMVKSGVFAEDANVFLRAMEFLEMVRFSPVSMNDEIFRIITLLKQFLIKYEK